MPLFQKPVPALPSSLGLSGKTALVTGANRGLGYTTSQHFVRHGISKLVLAVRSRQAGETTRETLLQEAAGRKDGQTLEIIVRELDMNSLASVSAFVRGLEADELQVHIALLNAGINKMEWSVSEETGNESVFQVNYVSTAALSLLLLPILIRTSEASGSCSYLTVVGSEMQGMSSWNKKKVAPASVFGEFNNKSTFSGFTRYGDTKYLVFQFVHRLAQEVDPAKITVLVTCPGMVATEFGRADMPFWLVGPVKLVQALRARTPKQGGLLIAYAATGLAGDAAHGELVTNMAVNP